MHGLLTKLLYFALLIFLPIIEAQEDQFALARSVITATCANESHTKIARTFNIDVATYSDIVVNGTPIGWRATLSKTDDRFELQKIAPGGQFQGARIEWYQNEKPKLSISVGAGCRIRIARRMVYDDTGKALAVAQLDDELNETGEREPLNPPVPAGKSPAGIRVAMVDSGVNYTLPLIRDRLARDADGQIIGYDYWDLDDRPFDANPARSPFFPQRHGTRTAGILLREAPMAILVPYRYPRPDMSRLADLVRDAVDKNIRIIGMPLGSNDADEWAAFEQAARNAPEILFIASAGNRGVDLDRTPTYPASLDLDNLIVVTSADDSGGPAVGSNWGLKTVDLLVPAEFQIAIDFAGNDRMVSGSSYAVSRVAALAARLIDKHPGWSAQDLKNAIFKRTLRDGFNQFVAVGYIPDPASDNPVIESLGQRTLDIARPEGHGALGLDLDIVLLDRSGWQETTVENMVEKLGEILEQCDIPLGQVELHRVRVPERFLDFEVGSAYTLTSLAGVRNPAVYLVRDTRRQPAFDAEAFGRANSGPLTWLTDTVWLTSVIDQPEIALAHELFHVLSNSGEHTNALRNLMNPRTRPDGWLLTTAQCLRARDNAKTHQILQISG